MDDIGLISGTGSTKVSSGGETMRGFSSTGAGRLSSLRGGGDGVERFKDADFGVAASFRSFCSASDGGLGATRVGAYLPGT